MAKEFDIYLNKRLTECDIIVYSIPYRDGLTAVNKLVLESCLENYILQKFVAVQTGSELVSHIDKMIKTCYERLGLSVQINASAEFQTHYTAYPTGSAVDICAADIASSATVFAQAEGALQINAAPLLAFVGKSVGKGSSVLEPDVELKNILKQSILTIRPTTEIGVNVTGISEQNFLRVDSSIDLTADLANLCYRITTAGNTAVQIAASVLGTEFHYSLGSGANAIAFNTAVTKEQMHKYEAVNRALHILSSVTESITQYMTPSDGSILLNAAVEPILKRYRLLGEMDTDTLSAYDDMTLEDIDFVIL